MRIKSIKLLLATGVLVLASLACGLGGSDGGEATEAPAATSTSAPTNTPEPAVSLGDEYRSEDGGFAFRQVSGWNTEEFFGIASHSPPDADEDTGPTILLIGGLNETDYTLDSAFAEFTAEFGGDGADMTFGEPYDLTVAGADARAMDISGSTPGGGQATGRVVVVLVTPRQSLVAFGFSRDADWDSYVSETFDAVVASLSFFEPAFDPNTQDTGVDEGILEEVRQWATTATASTQYGEEGWSANQATGEPDVYPDCGDSVFAWASEDYSTVEWIEVGYENPVTPLEIHIYETYNPGGVISVDVRDVSGDLHNVYSASAGTMDDCASVLSIYPTLDVQISSVRITIDQAPANDWVEIDAVELVGHEGQAGMDEVPAADGSAAFEIPDGFLWRNGGESGIGDDEYSALGGMDVDSNGFLYASDNIHGIWIYDAQGSFVQQIDHNEFNNPNDVAVSEQGGGYIVAISWGNNSVFVMDFNGNILTRFGSEGNGPGQFGTFSPQSVTVDLNNNIYVLDNNETDDEEDLDRIQVFDIDGNYLYEWTIEDDFYSATAIEFWAGPTPAEDRIFVLGFLGGYIMEFDLQGNLVRTEIGLDALDFSGPQDLAMDLEGNFYVTTWTPDGVMKLDHDGNLLGHFGVEIEDGDNPWGEGGFYQPGGVAVAPDGSQVYANDWSGDYAYITAFEYE